MDVNRKTLQNYELKRDAKKKSDENKAATTVINAQLDLDLAAVCDMGGKS